MANRMILNETSYFGAGSISEIVTEAKKRAFKKALVVTDPDLIKFNVAKNVTDLLEKAGLAYDIFSQVKANPTVKVVKAGIEAFKAAGADYLIAIGGGSSMDTAKAIGIIINNPEYADVTSLEGRYRHKESLRSYNRSSYNSRHGRRGNYQLCYHRRGEEEKVRLR